MVGHHAANKVHTCCFSRHDSVREPKSLDIEVQIGLDVKPLNMCWGVARSHALVQNLGMGVATLLHSCCILVVGCLSPEDRSV